MLVQQPIKGRPRDAEHARRHAHVVVARQRVVEGLAFGVVFVDVECGELGWGVLAVVHVEHGVLLPGIR